jgi:apolipoprotein N-acyltransferase
MLSTSYVHPEFGFLCPTPRLRRLVRLALVSILLGTMVFAIGRRVYPEDGALLVAQIIQTVTALADDKPALASQIVTTRVDDKPMVASPSTDKNLVVIREAAAPILAQNVPTQSIVPAHASKKQRAPSKHRHRN